MSLCNLMFNGNMYYYISYLPWEKSEQSVIYQFATSNFQHSYLQIYRNSRSTLDRTDDIQINKVEMTSFLATNWLKKTLKSLFLVRKLFPRSRLIANSRNFNILNEL